MCVFNGNAKLLAELMNAGGFVPDQHPGSWLSPDGISVDLMVPEALAGAGSRGARLGTHGKRVARRAKGLEGALVDRDRMTIAALDPTDDRSVSMVAGSNLAPATIENPVTAGFSARRCGSWGQPIDLNRSGTFL